LGFRVLDLLSLLAIAGVLLVLALPHLKSKAPTDPTVPAQGPSPK
jgi:hypothetical protein